MDNRKIDIWSEGKADFDLAMCLAMSGYKKAFGYRIHNNCFILYWTDSEKQINFPYVMNTQEITPLVWGWLEKTNPDYPRPDHDGDNEKGFRVFNESWGMVGGDPYAFIAITPIWAMYGK